jgi:DMSO reductase iron-sulfur subunit
MFTLRPTLENTFEKEITSPANCETPQADGSTLWEIRTEEQAYAFLPKTDIQEENRYGQKIDLVDLSGLPTERSLHINENPEVGCNPNRNKQHGFFFTADNCIGCHACEAACSEKNENPAHLAFRSVGYVEGGSYPDYQRMNISMACNHCDDPVCLKGCPTGAYTKHAEYGAVLQDPDTCFGCGYCTWVCPYNAPQLDPVQGQVSKCNMCVDRLEVNLKPACVSACVGNALDFGVIENIPENREQAKTSIPGFPDPSITHPNIRFQQTKTLPEEMKRTDSMPVKYHKDQNGQYQPVIDQKSGIERHWNFSRLSSRENPLVLFTLAAQTSMGAFAISFLGAQLGLPGFTEFAASAAYAPLAGTCLLLIGFGLFMSTLHLGKPIRFYRGFNNWRHSPVAREGLGIAGFMALLGFHIVSSLPANELFQNLCQVLFGFSIDSVLNPSMMTSIATTTGFMAVPCGLAGLYFMNRCYRIKARPFWNHWQVATSFFGNMLSLGALLTGFVIALTLGLQTMSDTLVLQVCVSVFVLGALSEGIGLSVHARDMNKAEHEGAASHYIQKSTFGKTYILRNINLGLAITLGLGLLIAIEMDTISPALIVAGSIITTITMLSSALISRALFYVLVIPTTMPGAFFWKNKGFEAHAKDIGLADLPQVGIIPDGH